LFTDVTRDMRIAREEIFGPVVTVTRCEHAIQTLREFSYTKMVRFPSGLGTIPSWRSTTSSTRPQAQERQRHEPGIANPIPDRSGVCRSDEPGS
jgi:hypothetical protein